MLFSAMHPSWQELLVSSEGQLESIEKQLQSEPNTTPEATLIMRAFELPPNLVKVLVIGQDPYPSPGVACGLAFAVTDGAKQPQSLKNLMKELATDLPGVPASGDLVRWSEQGVLLLNSALTTSVGAPGSHSKIWRGFTELVIAGLDRHLNGALVTLSLGEHAKKLASGVSLGEVIQATHPSPLSASRGFFGSRIYSRVNFALRAKSIAPIDWSC